jgi:DNA-directed RNA polymerase specialized sigma24 family protein
MTSKLAPLMNDAYNLARWLMRNQEDAEDMVQESYLRAVTQRLSGFDQWEASRIRKNISIRWLRFTRTDQTIAWTEIGVASGKFRLQGHRKSVRARPPRQTPLPSRSEPWVASTRWEALCCKTCRKRQAVKPVKKNHSAWE